MVLVAAEHLVTIRRLLEPVVPVLLALRSSLEYIAAP